MKINKNSISNFVFIVLIVLLIYKPTRIYFIRLISFSPSVITQKKREVLTDYNWSIKGLNTENIEVNKLKDKVIFINFWATWCPPCIAELPSIQLLYDDYKDKITFIFVTSEDKDKVEAFYSKNNYKLPTYRIITKLPDVFNTNSIPKTYIISKNGEILVNKNGAADWNSSVIRNLLDREIKKHPIN
ncbi:cytochrome c biogenesis protein CcmG, thiol:disulfide interchange protein DsbE [Tenacibaculum sp. 190524A02b]|uniref:Cytochrome c biogenesis protein CcmG, thiol:disulfide interchange protein DsbE n=1 Tax=Tenacibaculum vairaonense TaxID=3137860 RepID=A0ABM9PR12_9FLAO